jgi:hypothetical protein
VTFFCNLSVYCIKVEFSHISSQEIAKENLDKFKNKIAYARSIKTELRLYLFSVKISKTALLPIGITTEHNNCSIAFMKKSILSIGFENHHNPVGPSINS